MSFASFAIGSNEVEATSTAASIAVLIISAISTNAIASSSTISSIRETSTASAATSTSTAISEVDPHVPLRAEHVDDPLEREVEALDDRGARGAGVITPGARAPARSIAAPCSYPSRWRIPCTSGQRHSSPTTCGQRTTSPSARGSPSGSSSRPSIGNERTSVASSTPRCSRFSARISSGGDERDPELAVLDALRGEHVPGERRPRRPRRPRRRCGSRPRPRSSCWRAVPVSSACRLYASTIRCTSLCRTTSSCPNSTNPIPSIARRMSRTWIRPGRLLARQVDLGDVAGDDHLRAEAEPGQEHLHLLGRRVLRLVEDDERVVERAAAHEGERRDLDRARGPCTRSAGRRPSCRRARRRAAACTGRPSRACRPAGSRAARPPRPPGG